MESQPQNPLFRINPENIHPCVLLILSTFPSLDVPVSVSIGSSVVSCLTVTVSSILASTPSAFSSSGEGLLSFLISFLISVLSAEGSSSCVSL